MSKTNKELLTSVKAGSELKSRLLNFAKEVGMDECSRICKINRSHFYEMFSPKGNPTTELIERFCKALDLEIIVRKKQA